MSYSEVWLIEAVLKRCIIHFSIEEAQEEIHTLDIQLFSDTIPYRLLVKVWWELAVIRVWYFAILLVYLSCSELFRRLERILRHHLTVSHGHVLIIFCVCLEQIGQTASFMDWTGWVRPICDRHRLRRLILLLLVLHLFVRVIVQVISALHLIQ